ncbi:hypothetical protein [Aeromicrobium sp. 50.2.37]|uniref:hypothetical protein n=1 Tax=Aeromicrobium sp. 50.2.37 TaxID=2969305 RepID=UPI00214FEEB9|nr:hypothetical protein [Aeromicrobium sp. 50.2.37]MCR4511760.1 hypothetical protein [Aeromicrobium sp. 50.2.37]
MKRKVIVVLVTTLVVALGATGTVMFVQHRAEVERVEAAAAEERAAERERRAELAAAKAAHEECIAATADYLAAVQDIDAVLDVGVNEEDYGDLVRDASRAARRVGPVEERCRDGLVEPLDAALDLYTDGASTWNDCLYDDIFTECDVDGLDLSGEYWEGASLLVDAATLFVEGAGGDEA